MVDLEGSTIEDCKSNISGVINQRNPIMADIEGNTIEDCKSNISGVIDQPLAKILGSNCFKIITFEFQYEKVPHGEKAILI
jgi:hypothetical protein